MRKHQSRPALQFETLEPRLLLAADLAVLQHDAVDLSLNLDATTHEIVVFDNLHGTVLERHDLNGTDKIDLKGGQGDDVFRINLDSTQVVSGRVGIDGSAGGNDTVVGPGQGARWSLDGSGSGHVGNIGFTQIGFLQGQGTDTLTGPDRDTDWTISGTNGSGTVAGTSFSGFADLVGSDTGADTFLVQPSGYSSPDKPLNNTAISVDGGAGQEDALVVQGNHLLSVAFTQTRPGAAILTADGMTVTYAGTERLNLRGATPLQDVAQNVSWSVNGNGDDNIVSDDANDPAQISIVANQGPPVATFAKPSAGGSASFATTGFSSTITLGTLTLPGVDLSVQSGQTSVIIEPLLQDVSNQINVAPGATVDTSLASGVAGDITIAAANIDVQSGAKLLAQGASGGAVTLTATNLRYASGLILDTANDVTARGASITLTGATITATGSVTIQALAGDRSLEGSMNNYLDGWGGAALSDLEQLTSLLDTLPISVLYKNSSADISLQGTSITTSSGDVTIDANAESDATGTGIFWASPGTSTSAAGGLAFVFVESDAKATVEVGAGTAINAVGDVSVTTEGTTNATGTARVSQNTGRGNSPTNPQNVQAAVAIGITNLTSTITTDQDSLLHSSTGDVTVTATGTNANAPGAETESYKDGLAGFTLGLALSDNNVKVTSLGEIEAGATTPLADPAPTFNPFTSADPTTDAIAVDTTAGYQTGDAVTYSTGGGGAVRGLVDGQTYYVIVQDGTHLKLAASRSDALSGAAVDFGALPALEWQNGTVSRFSQVIESTGQFVFDYDPGIQLGFSLYYDPTDGEFISGVAPKSTGTLYTVIDVSQSASGNQWLVTLEDASGNTVRPNLVPLLVDPSNDYPYGFDLDNSAIVLEQAQPTFTTGQALTFRQPLGLTIPTLTDGTTYYLVKDPTDTTNTVFRLAASQADATSSDGYSNTVALGEVDTGVTSGSSHKLTANNPGGIAITAKLNTTEAAVTKSGQGGEPETSDLAGKGELLPVVGTMLSNIKSMATVQKDQQGNLTNKMDDKINDNAQGSGSNTNFGVAATVAFVKSTNNAVVEVSNVIRSQTNLTINADITHGIQTQAEGVKSPSQDGTTTLTIAGSAAVGLSYDNAQVIVDEGSAIDVQDTITADATVTYPFLAPLDSPEDFGNYILGQLKANPLSTISGFLGNFFLLKQDLVNSWARAVDNDPKADISIAGAVDFQSRSTFATVDVLGGAQINQMADYHNPNQRVLLNADTDMKMINVGGIFDYDLSPEGLIKAARLGPSNALQPYGAQGGKAGFGGAYRQLDLNTTTHAIIHGVDATTGEATAVTTGSSSALLLDADNEVFVLGVTQSGTKAGQFGISGSAAISEQNTSTVAAIESGTVVTGNVLSLYAHDDTVLPTYSGDVVKGGNLGFGIGLVYDDIDRATQAYIGDIADASTAGSDIEFGFISLTATNTGDTIGFALAGAVAADEPSTPSAPPSNLDSQANQSGANLPAGSDGKGNYGIAVSGDVVFAQVNDSALAFIDDVGKVGAASVDLVATNDTKYIGGAGSVAIAESDGTSVGLAGSYSEIDLGGATQTYVNRADLTVGSGGLTMAATWSGLASAAAAGGSGAPRQGGIATSGSVAVNRLAQTTASTVGGGATLGVAGQVTVTATDELQALAIAGSADYGGKAGVGAAGALNILSESVAVGIQDSSAVSQTAGNSYWTASFADPGADTPRIVAVAGAVALSQGLAADGIVALNSLADPTSGPALKASLDNSTYTSGPATLVLTAENSQTMIAVGAAIAGGSKVAIGAAGAANVSRISTVAEVKDSTFDLWALQLNATRGGKVEAVAVGAALSKDTAAIAGSAAVNVIGELVDAHVEATVAPTGDSKAISEITITASDAPDITAAAGALSINTNGAAAIGAALAFNQVTDHSYAWIGGAHLQVGTGVSSGASTSVSASMGGTVEAIAVGAEGGQSLAAGGSVAVTQTDTDLGAAIETGAQLTTHGSVAVAALGTMTFDTVAGQVDGALDGAAVGLANTTLDRKDTTNAYIDDASVSVLGTAGDVSVSVGDSGAKTDGVSFSGLSVTAVSVDTVLGVTAGAAAAADASVAGSATLTLLDKATQALISDTVDLSGATIANINMLAYDETSSRTGAGALAGAEYAGVGAGADVSKITKFVQAMFNAPQTTVAGNAVIIGLSKEKLLSTAAVASGGIGALAGANSTIVFDLQTTGIVDYQAPAVHLTTGGSVLVAADDQVRVDQILGNINGGAGSIGASAAVVDYARKDVTALIDSGAVVQAQAADSSTAINAATGHYTVAYTAPDDQVGEVQPPNTTVDLDKLTGNAPNTLGNLDAAALTQERNATADYRSMRGVAVTATGQDSLKAFTFAAGGGGGAVEVAANVVVARTNVGAGIGNGVHINDAVTGAGSQQSVLLAAGQDFSRLGINGALAGGGLGATPGADVTLVSLNTGAEIYNGAFINAVDDIVVDATTNADILALTAGLSATVAAGLDGGAVVIHIDDTTNAEVLASTLQAANVAITATDTSEVVGIAGEVALSAGGGLGASAVVTIIEKTTTATIGGGAIIDGLANSGDSIAVLDGTSSSGPDQLNTKEVQGVAVQAVSVEDVTTIAASGATGIYMGFAGGAAVASLDVQTTALVGTNAQVNQKSGASAAQAVSVAAGNLVTVLDIGGAIGLGGAGIAGGMDTGFIRNNTLAQVDIGANVKALADVDVLSVAQHDLDSYALSVGAGAAGIAGAVSVWTVGTGFDSTYSDTSNTDNALEVKGSGSQYSGSSQYSDGQTNRTDIKNLLGNYNATSGSNNTAALNGVVGQSLSDYSGSEPQNKISTTMGDTGTSSTSVYVAPSSTVTTGGDLTTEANHTMLLHQAPGTGALGLGAVGGAVAIANVGQLAAAEFDGTANVGGTMTVEATYTGTPTQVAFGGAAGFFVGIGAQVAIYRDSSSATATVGDGAVVTQAQTLNVDAASTLEADVTAEGATGGALAVGAAVAEATYKGAASATVGDVTIGQASDTQVGDIAITSQATIHATAASTAVAIGIGAGAGNRTTVDLAPTTSTSLTHDGQLHSSGDVKISATSDVEGTATSDGRVAGGITVGISYATATMVDNVNASIGNGFTITAATLEVIADSGETATSAASTNGGETLLGSGVGAHGDVNLTSNTSAYVLGSNITTEDGITILAANEQPTVTANAQGANGSGVAVIGTSDATAASTPTVLAYANGASLTTTVGGGIAILAGQGSSSAASNVTAAATGSEGNYSAGDSIASTSNATMSPTVTAALGDPNDPETATRGTTLAVQGDLQVRSSSYSGLYGSAINSGSGFFSAEGDAQVNLTYNKATNTIIGAGSSSTVSGTATITALSTEYAEPAAAGNQSESIYAHGNADATVSVTRSTTVDFEAGSSLAAGNIVVDATSSTTSAPSPLISEHGGTWNAYFDAEGLTGRANPAVTFTINDPSASAIIVQGTLTAPTVSLNAQTHYDINLATLSDVTAGAGTTFMTSDVTVTTNDSVGVSFTDTGSVVASSGATLHAGFDAGNGFGGSVINGLTALEYSEKDIKPEQSDTNVTITTNGVAQLQDNDNADGVTTPKSNLSATVAGDSAVQLVANWKFTAKGDNESYGTHILTKTPGIDEINDFASQSAQLARREAIDPADLARSAASASPPMSDPWEPTGTSAHSDNPTDHALAHATTSDNSGDASFARGELQAGLSLDPDTSWLADNQTKHDRLSAYSSFDGSDTSRTAVPAAPGAARIDPATGWLIQGQDEADDWLELTGDPAMVPVPAAARIARWP